MLNDLVFKLIGLPELASEHGADVDKFIIYVHYLMGALFVGWIVYFLYALYRFSSRRNPKADYHGVRSHASSYVEVAVATVEAVLLIGFAIPLWSKVVDEFPPDSESTVIQVAAQQFAWNARYAGPDGQFGRQDAAFISQASPFGIDPDDPASQDDVVPPLNTIKVPVNKPVVVRLSSLDVIHSFKLYNMRVNQDAIPGLMIPVHFTPTKTGSYQVVCAQLCGVAHANMRGYFYVVEQEEYDQFLADNTSSGAAGDAGGFE